MPMKNKEILAVIPDEFASLLASGLEAAGTEVYEIRLSAGKKAYLVTREGIRFVTSSGALSGLPDMTAPTVTEKVLEELTDRATGYSAYAHTSELEQGYIAYPGGYRIGIASRGSSGSMKTGAITSVCIRLPIKFPVIRAPELDGILSGLSGGLLIAGPPGSGKTTLLRYCAAKLSDGGNGFRRVAVVDERSELSGGERGDFGLGACTDVIAGRPKSEGIMTAVRCFSPEFVICDEIGSLNETESILEGLNTGVTFVCSMHAGDLSQLIRRRQFVQLFRENVFSSVVLLSASEKGKIEGIYSRGAVNDEIRRSCDPRAYGGGTRVLFGVGLPQERETAEEPFGVFQTAIG